MLALKPPRPGGRHGQRQTPPKAHQIRRVRDQPIGPSPTPSRHPTSRLHQKLGWHARAPDHPTKANLPSSRFFFTPLPGWPRWMAGSKIPVPLPAVFPILLVACLATTDARLADCDVSRHVPPWTTVIGPSHLPLSPSAPRPPTSPTNKTPGISWPNMLFSPLPASVPN